MDGLYLELWVAQGPIYQVPANSVQRSPDYRQEVSALKLKYHTRQQFLSRGIQVSRLSLSGDGSYLLGSFVGIDSSHNALVFYQSSTSTCMLALCRADCVMSSFVTSHGLLSWSTRCARDSPYTGHTAAGVCVDPRE